jgi:hypothetical protein
MALDLPDDLEFHRTNWRAERIGWFFILAIMVSAVLGLAGRGPLGVTRVGDETLAVVYDRVMRNDARGTVTIRLGPSVTHDSVVRLWASQGILHSCSPDEIVPTPDEVVTGGDQMTFRIHVTPGADSATVILNCAPRATGVRQGALGIVNGPSVTLRTLVLP